MMLWPPIFTTFAQGRIVKLCVFSVACCNAASVKEAESNCVPSVPGAVALSILFIFDFQRSYLKSFEFKNIQFKGAVFRMSCVQRTKGGLSPVVQSRQGLRLNARGQASKAGPGSAAFKKLSCCSVDI